MDVAASERTFFLRDFNVRVIVMGVALSFVTSCMSSASRLQGIRQHPLHLWLGGEYLI